jgi:hypothetical protein
MTRKRIGLVPFAAALAIVAATAITVRAASEIKPLEADLKKAIEAKDFGALDRVILQIREVGGEEAAKMLVKIAQKIPPGEDLLYWRLLNGVGGFQDEAGLKEIADTILSSSGGPQGFTRDLMFAMQNNRSPKAPGAVHARVLEKGADDLKLMAADQLGLIELSESVDVLISALKREEKHETDLKRRILNSLKSLTGADCGAALNWEKWWADARKDGPQGRRKRESNTGTVVDEGFRGPETEVLSKIPPGMILVLKADTTKCDKAHGAGSAPCNFDHIETILDQMKIPHTVATIEDVNAGKVSFEGRMAVVMNCVQVNDHCVCPTCKAGGSGTTNRLSTCTGCDKHEIVNHRLSGFNVKVDPTTGKPGKPDPISGNAKKLKEWVERGGYLFSEDYGIWGELELAWPNFVKAGKSLKQKTVTCSPARGRTTHPMLRGVFVDPNAQVANGPSEDGGTSLRDPNQPEAGANIERSWVIDDDSPLINVTGGNNVVLLMTSEDLRKEAGDAASAVALTFLPAGPQSEKYAGEGHPEKLQGGRVVHVLSHFGKQNSREDEFALQNLLLNFLLESHRRFPKGVK